MHALGEGPEVTGVRETSRRGAGLTRLPRHHVLPQEHRKWFEERGFVGDMDIDNFTIELDAATHQAAHGGGDWRLGRAWPGEWNRRLMSDLYGLEERYQRRLQPQEIIEVARDLMNEYEIMKPFMPYKGR